jgi:hypothetical protein
VLHRHTLRQAVAVLTSVGGLEHSGRMVARRLPDNQGDREVHLRAHDSGQFIEVIQSARWLSAETLVMTVKAFASDVLYVALTTPTKVAYRSRWRY